MPTGILARLRMLLVEPWRSRVQVMTRTSTGGFADDQWAPVAAALIAFGVLPKSWRKPVALISAAVAISRLL
jgi:hypothetical protein